MRRWAHRVAPRILGRPQQEEARKILAVAFDRPPQHPRPVDLRGYRGGDAGGVREPLFGQHLDAARRVIERGALDLRVAREEVQALVQRHRVRKRPPELRELDALHGDQVVDDAHAGLRHDRKLISDQVVVVFVDRTGQGVLDGHHRPGGAPVLEALEEVLEPWARQDLHSRTQQFARGLLAESAALSLKSDWAGSALHFVLPSQRRTPASGRPMRSSARSTLWSTRSITVCGLW